MLKKYYVSNQIFNIYKKIHSMLLRSAREVVITTNKNKNMYLLCNHNNVKFKHKNESISMAL